jgi:hypothetical protein
VRGPRDHVIRDIEVVAPDDVWAVGWYFESGNFGLIMHWNGEQWRILPSPDPESLTELQSVAAFSSEDAWVVGWGEDRRSEKEGALLLHWDGTRWSIGKYAERSKTHLTDIAIAEGQAWAVGASGSSLGPPTSPLMMRLCPVALGDRGFSAEGVPAEIGERAFFRVTKDAAELHRFTDASGMGLFDSGPLDAGSSFDYRFTAAGGYPVEDGTSMDRVVVRVPLEAEPQGTGYKIRWAWRRATSGYVHDVEIRRPGEADFTSWRRATVERGAHFDPDGGPGTYEFRARLRRAGGDSSSAWSPVLQLEV